MIVRKNKNANLENKRSTFFQIGLIIGLLLVIAAFQYRVYDSGRNSLPKFSRAYFEQEDTQITTQEPPEIKELPKQKALVIKIKPDDFPETKDIFIDVSFNGPDFETTLPDIADEPRYKEDSIYISVERLPEFPGGYAALLKYLGSAIKYPSIALGAGIQGTVYIEFVVEADGSTSNYKILRSVGGGCTEEALRAVKNMPEWEPALQNMRKVRYKFVLPVKFTLH
ncbi:MAG: energy transducer TonB [Chlorobi bacterium]|nr:energy transducer TonB [Chlorobiota bacterium]